MKYKPFLLGASLGLLILGLGVGVLVAENWAEIPGIFKRMSVLGSRLEKMATPPVGEAGLLPTMAGEPSEQSSCKMKDFSAIGISGCFPGNWAVTSDEGSRGVVLGSVVMQSPDFKVLVDQGNDGAPAIKIKSGYQLSIRATRITADNSKGSMAELKGYWEANRVGHAIARQEERKVGGQPALYHVLSTPKEGGQTDAHIIKDPLLYNINFYFSDGQNGQGEDFYRDILDKINFGSVDAKIEENSDKLTVSPLASPVTAGQPITITISKSSSLGISSQSELPMIVRRSKVNGTTIVLGVARPQGDGVDQGTYALTWAGPEAGDYGIVAQVVKNGGMIYESAGVGVTVVNSKSKP